MKKSQSGFTLIELLVVIAIIGILASVVLVSLQSARKKAYDTRVIADVQQIKVALETNFNGNSYSDLTGATYISPLPTGAVGTTGGNINMLISDIITNQISGGVMSNMVYGNDDGSILLPSSVVITKSNTNPGSGYAIYAKMPSTGTLVFCMDSKGNIKSNATYPTQNPADNTVATTCQ